MNLADIASIIDKCEQHVAETPKLSKLLHDSEFVMDKINKVKSVFDSNCIALILNQLTVLLRQDTAVKKILKDECGALSDEDYYPHFLLYCSMVIYIEYIQINAKSKVIDNE